MRNSCVALAPPRSRQVVTRARPAVSSDAFMNKLAVIISQVFAQATQQNTAIEVSGLGAMSVEPKYVPSTIVPAREPETPPVVQAGKNRLHEIFD